MHPILVALYSFPRALAGGKRVLPVDVKCYTEDVTERSILAILANGEISSPAHVLSVSADRIVGRLSGSDRLSCVRRVADN